MKLERWRIRDGEILPRLRSACPSPRRAANLRWRWRTGGTRVALPSGFHRECDMVDWADPARAPGVPKYASNGHLGEDPWRRFPCPLSSHYDLSLCYLRQAQPNFGLGGTRRKPKGSRLYPPNAEGFAPSSPGRTARAVATTGPRKEEDQTDRWGPHDSVRRKVSAAAVWGGGGPAVLVLS